MAGVSNSMILERNKRATTRMTVGQASDLIREAMNSMTDTR
jgi:hypothetical protein